MLAKRIIPCLDVKEGRVVKGVNFVNLRDAGDPVEQARAYDAQGADELVFLDISATHEGRQTMIEVVRQVAGEVFMPFTVGGGVRTCRRRPGLAPGWGGQELSSAAVRTRRVLTAGASISAASASSWPWMRSDVAARSGALGGLCRRRQDPNGSGRYRVVCAWRGARCGEILLTSMDE